MNRFVGYVRVSTEMQAKNNSPDTQKWDIQNFIKESNAYLVELHEETETGSENERPVLHKAIETCQKFRATLLVNKLDRLSRDALFLMNFRTKYNINFKALDLNEDNEFMLPIRAQLAQMERKAISRRTKEALQAKKERGWKPTGENLWKSDRNNKDAGSKVQVKKKQDFRSSLYMDIDVIIDMFFKDYNYKPSSKDIVEQLNERRFTTYYGKKWSSRNLNRLLNKWILEWRDTYNFEYFLNSS